MHTFSDNVPNSPLSLPRLRMASQPCKKQRKITTALNSARQACCVAAQPSVLTARWLWVKNWENLTEQERAELEQLKGRFPLLRQLAEQREGL
jgi:hypothetical protein